eukprot:m.349744 g.349744  ORF g.349744 m.349744 type:complete len:312 (+) comp27955_c2_seq4:125-1060(+)
MLAKRNGFDEHLGHFKLLRVPPGGRALLHQPRPPLCRLGIGHETAEVAKECDHEVAEFERLQRGLQQHRPHLLFVPLPSLRWHGGRRPHPDSGVHQKEAHDGAVPALGRIGQLKRRYAVLQRVGPRQHPAGEGATGATGLHQPRLGSKPVHCPDRLVVVPQRVPAGRGLGRGGGVVFERDCLLLLLLLYLLGALYRSCCRCRWSWSRRRVGYWRMMRSFCQCLCGGRLPAVVGRTPRVTRWHQWESWWQRLGPMRLARCHDHSSASSSSMLGWLNPPPGFRHHLFWATLHHTLITAAVATHSCTCPVRPTF